MPYFQRLLINTLTFLALAVLFPSHIFVGSFLSAILASFSLSLLNTLVKPVLTILSLPLTLVTLGMFSFIINGLILTLTSKVVGSDHLGFSSFSWAVIASLIISFVNMIVSEHQLSKL